MFVAIARWGCLATLIAVASFAWAARIEIDTGDDPNARLEIRTIVLPDGTETDLYVIEADRIVLTIDGDRLVGSRIEFNATQRIVRVIGRGSFQSDEETIEGGDLVFAIDDETFLGEDVLIVTGEIDVVGASARRVPGQVDVLDGSFSPCSRCGQEVEDYGFRAKRIELYPGDRLVAWEADVLVRGRVVLSLPLLVIPLAPADRQPGISLTRGTATERAEVVIDWPYAAGANAIGTFSVRYWADVVPGAQDPLGLLLGGSVETSYLGGGIDHRFFTARGSGRFEVFYTPSFLPPTGEPREPADLRVIAQYATDPSLSPPRIALSVERDDARRDRLWEYRLQVDEVQDGVHGTFLTQGFVPVAGSTELPSYHGRSTPIQTVMQVILEPEDRPLRVADVAIERLRLDLGVLEDLTDPTNRSVAGNARILAGRAVLDHRVEVVRSFWPGLEVRAVNDFTGRYYGTGERYVDWLTDVRVAQAFPGGRVEATYRRDINEGETPFRFDRVPVRNRVDATLGVRWTPSPWFDLTSDTGYVIADTRDPEAVGWQEVRTTLRLLAPLAWADLQIANAYDPKTGDPGTIDADLSLRTLGQDVRLVVDVDHEHDLSARPPRGGGTPEDTTESSLEARATFGSVAELDLSVGYLWNPAVPSPDTPWRPLEVGATLGTLGQQDAIPGLRVSYRVNLNTGDPLDVAFQAAARLGPVTFEASERIDPVAGTVTDSRLALAVPGVALLEGRGIVFLPPSWLGLDEDPEATQRWTVRLRHTPTRGTEIGSLELVTVRDPTLDEGSFRDTTLQARFRLDETRVTTSRFTVDVFADLRIADATMPVTYLRRASLELGADLFGTVGVQGSLGYRGTYDPATDSMRTAQLTLDAFTVTARIVDDLFVGARLDDIWEFAADDPQRSPFNIQPTLFVTWDRCCWALIGEWDTATGRIRIALTTAGSDVGVQDSFGTPLTLPGRGRP